MATHPLVLAVDDNEDNLLLLIHALDIFGFPNISTLRGRSVLRLAQTYRPDLILLDIVMSDISGIDVIKQLKQAPETLDIPIIAVTALAKADERNQILQAGCEDYLYKPYPMDVLESMLQRHLGRHHMASAS